MILLTHNMLISPMKAATKQLHLRIEAEELEVKEKEFNQEFLLKMLERVDWSALVVAAKSVKEDLPANKEELDLSSEDVLKKIHHCLFEINVVTGNLVCAETGRKFPIQAGIPNMLLVQDEL